MQTVGHKWNGCSCVRCGVVQETGHNWNGCTCCICGRVRDEEHRFADAQCVICGKKLNKNPMIHTIRRLYQKFAKECRTGRASRAEADQTALALVKQAQEGLPPHDAEDVLFACMEEVVFHGNLTGPFGRAYYAPPSALRPYIQKAGLPALGKLFHKVYGSGKDHYVDYQHYAANLAALLGSDLFSREQILSVCNACDWEKDEKREFLKTLCVVDGVLVTPCDFGEHDWVFEFSEREEEDGDNWGFSSTFATYRCKRCGVSARRKID